MSMYASECEVAPVDVLPSDKRLLLIEHGGVLFTFLHGGDPARLGVDLNELGHLLGVRLLHPAMNRVRALGTPAAGRLFVDERVAEPLQDLTQEGWRCRQRDLVDAIEAADPAGPEPDSGLSPELPATVRELFAQARSQLRSGARTRSLSEEQQVAAVAERALRTRIARVVHVMRMQSETQATAAELPR